MAQIGLGLIGLIAFIPGAIVIALGIAAGDMLVTVPLVAIGAVLLAVAMSIVSALSGIYRTALYRYAVDGQVPPAFASTGHGARVRRAQESRSPGRVRRGLRRFFELTAQARAAPRLRLRATGFPNVPLPTSPEAT